MANFRARQNVERKKQTLCKNLGASEPGSLAPNLFSLITA